MSDFVFMAVTSAFQINSVLKYVGLGADLPNGRPGARGNVGAGPARSEFPSVAFRPGRRQATGSLVEIAVPVAVQDPHVPDAVQVAVEDADVPVAVPVAIDQAKKLGLPLALPLPTPEFRLPLTLPLPAPKLALPLRLPLRKPVLKLPLRLPLKTPVLALPLPLPLPKPTLPLPLPFPLPMEKCEGRRADEAGKDGGADNRFHLGHGKLL